MLSRNLLFTLRQVQAFSRFHYSQSIPKPYTVPDSKWGQNRAARLEMAAAYRGLNQLGLNEGVCNHLTCMTPSIKQEEDVMLLIPYTQHWGQASASSLLGVDKNGKVVEGDGTAELSAACIHLGLRRARPDARVVMHTHQPYATTIACLKNPELVMLHQNSCRFLDRIAVDKNYTGLADAMDEGERLGAALGKRDVLFMSHHGVIVVADTVALAFEKLYYLERAAQVQILAQSTGQELSIVSPEVAKRTYEAQEALASYYADAFFNAMYSQLKQTQPEFEH